MQSIARWRMAGVGALVLACSMGDLGAVAAEQDLAVVSVRGISRLASAVEQVTGTVGEPVAADEVRAHVGMMLGSPELAGLNPDGVFQAVLPAGDWAEGGPPPFVVYAPVTGDGSDYLRALESSMRQVGDEDGVKVFEAPPGGMPPMLCVRLVSGFAVVGIDAEAVAAASATPAVGAANGGAPGVVVVRCHIPALLAMLEPKLEGLLEQMSEMSEAMQAAAAEAEAEGGASPAGMPPGMEGMDPAKILEVEAEYGLALLRQVEAVSLGLDLSDGALRVHTLIEPVEGSVIAAELARARPPMPALAHAVPPGALFAEVGYMPGIDPLLAGYAGFIQDLYGAMGDTFAGLGEMVGSMMEKLDGVYTGDFLMAVVPGRDGAPPAFVQAMGIRDPEPVRAMMKEGIEMMDDLASQEWFQQMYKTYRIEETGVRPYRGGEIQSYAMRIELADDMAGQMPPGFLNGLVEWMGNLRYDVALLDNVMLYTLGESYPIESAVDAILDRPYPDFRERAPAPESPPAIDVFEWRVFDTLRAVTAMLPEEWKEKAPGVPDGPGSISGYSSVRDGALTGVLSIPLKDVSAVAGQIAAMQSQFGGGGGGELGGGAGTCSHNLRQLVLYGYISAAEHQGELPDSWEDLAERLNPEQRALLPGLLQCPVAADSDSPSYEWVGGGPLSQVESPSTTVMIREIEPNHNGKRWVAFVDGHVELIE